MYATPAKRLPQAAAPNRDQPPHMSAEYAQSLLRMLTGGNESLLSDSSQVPIPNGQQLYTRHSLNNW